MKVYGSIEVEGELKNVILERVELTEEDPKEEQKDEDVKGSDGDE